MSLVLTDAQLDAWVEANGPVPDGYGEFVACLRRQERQHQDDIQQLRDQLSQATAPKLFFVPGRGLQDCPF